jgi:transcriptional regulator with XRE-family HTH domain
MPTLAQARRSKSLTQRQLADELGVERTLISAWERGVYRPGPGNLKKLCEVLDVTLDELVFIPRPARPVTSQEQTRKQIEAHNESMGYVDSTWLRGGRYDVDPAFHDKPSS